MLRGVKSVTVFREFTVSFTFRSVSLRPNGHKVVSVSSAQTQTIFMSYFSDQIGEQCILPLFLGFRGNADAQTPTCLSELGDVRT